MHSPLDGHLDCFQFGAVLNKAAVDIWIHVFCGLVFSLGLGRLGYP